MGLPAASHASGADLKANPGNDLYTAVIYLGPGDYHRFHSPTEWAADQRIHVSGELLSVAVDLVKRFPSILSLNERVALIGSWRHGFFAYSAVGAYNVGNITLASDEKFRANVPKVNMGAVDKVAFPDPLRLKRGDEVGVFNLGSTIVLVFEAPKNFAFSVVPGDRVKMGQRIAVLNKQ